LLDPPGERDPIGGYVRAAMEVADDLGPSDLRLAAGGESAMPLLAPPPIGPRADVDDHVPQGCFLASPGHADALVDVAPHQWASNQARRAGTGTTSRRPSLRVG